MIKGTTRVCGLIGDPVAHSSSPLIHNTLAQKLGIDLAYVTFRVQKEHVKQAVLGAYELNILGMNVTVPHKQEVMETLVDIDPMAKAIGAVNTLVRVEGGYKGYNTDILGLKRELEEEGVAIAGQEVIILGAGGASRAIAFLCADMGAAQVYLLNRTISKAEDIVKAVNTYFAKELVIPMEMAAYPKLAGKRYTAIQATSVGLHPHGDEAVIEDNDFYQMIHTGVDIIYNPAETKFMKLVKANGGTAYNGMKMLLYQAVAAFELWNDIRVGSEDAGYVYECLKKELNR